MCNYHLDGRSHNDLWWSWMYVETVMTAGDCPSDILSKEFPRGKLSILETTKAPSVSSHSAVQTWNEDNEGRLQGLRKLGRHEDRCRQNPAFLQMVGIWNFVLF